MNKMHFFSLWIFCSLICVAVPISDPKFLIAAVGVVGIYLTGISVGSNR